MSEVTLFPIGPTFGGPGVTAEDAIRLTGQVGKIYERLSDLKYHSLADLAAYAGASEAGASARIRDLRKAQWGHHTIVRRRVVGERARYEYRLVPKGEK